MARNEDNGWRSDAMSGAAEYMSVNQAAYEIGVDPGVIRRAMKAGKVKTKNHPWGTRVLLSDVEKLKRSTQPDNDHR